MDHMQWEISIREFVEEALSILQEDIQFDRVEILSRVEDFIRDRYKFMALRAGYPSDLVEAVVSVNFDRIHDVGRRIEQLKEFAKKSEELEALAQTFKRVTNILKNQEGQFQVKPHLFRESCESALWETCQELKAEVERCVGTGRYDEALDYMVKLRKPVDEFFDGVEILTKESEALKHNRVGVLQRLSGLFLSVADFSKFSI
jgi:glycyl-tRNA synthetase beta chain